MTEADTMVGRLDACCAKLLADIDNRHHELKKCYGKPSGELGVRSGNFETSEHQKSLSSISNTTRCLNILTGYMESLEELRTKYVKYFIESLRNEIEVCLIIFNVIGMIF